MRHRRTVFTATMLLLLSASARLATAQSPVNVASATGTIDGVITDTSLAPIDAAEISIALSTVHVRADARGRFRIVGIPAGNYLLAVRRVGYQAIASGVTVRAGDTLRLAFSLIPAAAELPSVTVSARSISAKLSEFEERRKRGNGQFFDQRDIESHNVVSVVDLLREAKGLRMLDNGRQLFAVSARQWTSCPVQVYLDGIPLAGVGPRADAAFDLNLLPSPKEIMAIEIYSGAASLPPWLPTGPSGGKPGCGAILLWTRDGSSSGF